MYEENMLNETNEVKEEVKELDFTEENSSTELDNAFSDDCESKSNVGAFVTTSVVSLLIGGLTVWGLNKYINRKKKNKPIEADYKVVDVEDNEVKEKTETQEKAEKNNK